MERKARVVEQRRRRLGRNRHTHAAVLADWTRGMGGDWCGVSSSFLVSKRRSLPLLVVAVSLNRAVQIGVLFEVLPLLFTAFLNLIIMPFRISDFVNNSDCVHRSISQP